MCTVIFCSSWCVRVCLRLQLFCIVPLLSPGNAILRWLQVDSTENMAKLFLQYVMLFIYAYNIVYLSRLQKSLKFAILVGKKSKICDFLSRTRMYFGCSLFFLKKYIFHIIVTLWRKSRDVRQVVLKYLHFQKSSKLKECLWLGVREIKREVRRFKVPSDCLRHFLVF